MAEDSSFDQILATVGDKGFYQRRLLFGFYSLYCIVTPFIVLVPIFLTTTPDHWCHVDGKPENVTLEEWKSRTIPWVQKEETEEYSKCKQYRNVLDSTADSVDQDSEIDCQNGWDFDKTWYDETLTTKNNWVCDQSDHSAAWLSVGLSGNIVGILVANRLSDMYGRKFVCFLLLEMFAVSSILRLFFSSGWIGYVVTFIANIPFPSMLQVGFVFVTEQVQSSWRPLANGILFVMWMVGMCIIPLLAWLTRSWIWLTVVTSTPCFLFVFAWPFVLESTRWQVSLEKTQQAFNSLSKISRINGIQEPQNLEKCLNNYIDEKRKQTKNQGNILDIFKSAPLVKLSVLLTVCWVCNLVTYYALNFNVHNLAGNQFLNFFLIGIAEGVSVIFGWIGCETIGRRFSQVFFFFLVIISTACPIFLATSRGVETVVCAIASKILINSSFYAFYLQMVEIYPTSHRTSLMGMSNAIVLLLNIGTPYIAYSSEYWSRMPYLIMCILSCIGFLMAFFIPETLDHNLPQTISDSEAYYADQSFWSYLGRNPKLWPKILIPFLFSNENKKT